MNLFNKSIMELNVLKTETEYIDLPKDVIYKSGDHIIINDKDYLIDKVKYHIIDGKIFQITYVAFENKRVPLTKEQIKLFQAMGLPLYA